MGPVPFPDGFLCLSINAAVSLTNPSPLESVYSSAARSALVVHGGSEMDMVSGLGV